MKNKSYGIPALVVVLSACSTTSELPGDLPPSASGLRPAKNGVVYRDYWLSLTGTTVDALRASSRFPATPDGYDELTSLKVPLNWKDNFGARIEGLLTPPATGDYTFFISSDDTSELWISSSDKPTEKRLIASVPAAVTADTYSKYPSQASVPVSLIAGKGYYFEVLHKEGTYSDHLTVQWQGPSLARQTLGGSFIASYPPALVPTESTDYRKGYSLGYRIGHFDGSNAIVYRDSFPFLDADKDGLYDHWEILFGLNPKNPADALEDQDGDLLTALDEFLLRTNPHKADTDGDGIPDGYEFAYGLDPLMSNAETDTDGDGVTDLVEYQEGSDPQNPASKPAPKIQLLSGYVGQYFSGNNFNKHITTRIDKSINFDWLRSSPATGVPIDNFTVRWSGQFMPPHTEGIKNYQFQTRIDDGYRLWIDGKLVLDKWPPQKLVLQSVTLPLEAGVHHTIMMEYNEAAYDARAYFYIRDAITGAEISPATSIYSVDYSIHQRIDTDKDGIPDSFELAYGLNSFVNDAMGIRNSAGITNLDAYKSGRNPWTLETVAASVSLVDSSVTLSWTPPTTRADGTKLLASEIAQFIIRYGTSSSTLTNTVVVLGNQTSYKFTALPVGTYFFEVVAVDTKGLTSNPSSKVSATVK